MKAYLNTISFKKILFLVLVCLFFIYGLHINIFDGPNPIHEWRKTDSLSITLNYMKGETFFSPKTNSISLNGNRNAAAEFPIIYYLIGNLWTHIGQNEFVFRILSVILIIVGIVLFSDVVLFYLKSKRLTLIFSVLIFSSPILLSYAHGFIPNPFAFAFILISGYYIFLFLQKNKQWAIMLFFVFSTLAVLIKITSVLPLIAFASSFFFYAMFHQRDLLKIHFKKIVIVTISLVISLTLICLWYNYAIEYNDRFKSELFSTTIRPVWEISAEKQKEIFNILLSSQLPLLYNKLVLLGLLSFSIYAIIFSKISTYFKWLITMSLLALISYFVLWFWVFDVHDYYLIEIIFVPIVIVYVLFIQLVKFNLTSRKFTVTLCVIVAFNILHATSYSQMRFKRNSFFATHSPFLSSSERVLWGWFHFNHSVTLNELQIKAAEIKNIIASSDTVYCVTDISPNTYLYTIDRVGMSKSLYYNISDSIAISDAILRGAKYMLFIGDNNLKQKLPYSNHEVYNSNRISIFDLTPYKH
jgi:4-amino-4-deoxy-L-arabinose transferase-like glycosyltransferase